MEAFSKVIKRMKELEFLFPDLDGSISSHEPVASRSPLALSPPTSSVHSSICSTSPHSSPKSSPTHEAPEPKNSQWVSAS